MSDSETLSAAAPVPPPKPDAAEKAAGGWGALDAAERHLAKQDVLVRGNKLLLSMNKPGGFDCPSCAWPDPATPKVFEYCENGAKAVAWEATRKRTTPEFFAAHTVTELRGWTDHALEAEGRLTHPMRYDAASDRYVPVSWETAFAGIGAHLRKVDPQRLELYTSGRASNEAAFLWQLLGRRLNTNNFPDCSNMCHETTSVALPDSLGVAKGTVRIQDLEATGAFFIFGHNPGTNAPRLMGYLHDMSKRGTPIVAFNPVRERALIKFADPQSPKDMLKAGGGQMISWQYHQLRISGDLAAVQGMAKALIEMDDAALAAGEAGLIDRAFIAEHTHGYEAFETYIRALPWGRIEHYAGLPRAEIESATGVYARAKTAIIAWGMGITQHRRGGEAVQQICNLLLMRGNVGKLGAGACPIRGHSNVQGDRTVGIYQSPKEPFLQGLERAFSFVPPREHGHDVAQCLEAMLRGEVDAFLGLGGNFFRAIPDTDRIEKVVPQIGLTVQIATKLNRSHLIIGKEAYLLPTLGRTEQDMQASGQQTITVEDSFSMVHGSTGRLAPASDMLRSEVAIISGLARAALPDCAIDWEGMRGNYALIRDKIEQTMPQMFGDYNRRIEKPGGFWLTNAAAERRWNTPNGRANFLFEDGLIDMDDDRPDEPHMQLMTMRSHDQFNTTVYSDNDRYRGIKGERMVAFMNADDMAALGFAEGDMVTLSTVSVDDVKRSVSGFRLKAYDIPPGCCGAYYPETNALMPLAHRDKRSNTPAAKSLPIVVSKVAA